MIESMGSYFFPQSSKTIRRLKDVKEKMFSSLIDRISIIETQLAEKDAKIAGLEYLLSTKVSQLEVGLKDLQKELAEKTPFTVAPEPRLLGNGKICQEHAVHQ